MNKLPSGRSMPIALRNEEGYLTAAEHLLYNGVLKGDRTGTGTRGKFGEIQVEYDLLLNDKPTVCLPSTKKVFWEKAVVELVWMISGSQRLKFLIDNGVNFWNNWVKPGTEVYKDLTWQQRRNLIPKDQRNAFDYWFERLTGGQDDAGFPELDEVAYQAVIGMLDALGIPKHKLVDGDLGPVYGVQWRNWPDIRIIEARELYEDTAWEKWGARGFYHTGCEDASNIVIKRNIDQLALLEKALQDRDQKAARRIVLTAWNAAFIDEMALPPCHTLAQWCIEPDENGDDVLHCKLYQRSGDWALGVPYNVAFYSIMTHMLCASCDLKAGKLFHTVGDAHLYENHVDQITEQLSRPINPDSKPFLQFKRAEMGQSLTDFDVDDVIITGYIPGKFIPAPVAV